MPFLELGKLLMLHKVCSSEQNRIGYIADYCFLGAAIQAAKLASYTYDPYEGPGEAFDWFVEKTCGRSPFIPDELGEVFGILNGIAGGRIGWREPPGITKGSGRRGDDENPYRSNPSRSVGTTDTPEPTDTNSGLR